MQGKKMTAEHFCWLYAAGCIENKHTKGELSNDAFLSAQRHLENNTQPTTMFVRTLFPKPFQQLEKGGARCTLLEMKEYWHSNHRDKSHNTPVHIAQINALLVEDNTIFAEVEYFDVITGVSKKIVTANCHGYTLGVGEHVYIHGSIIAEPYR